jgi:hypothetical protein
VTVRQGIDNVIVEYGDLYYQRPDGELAVGNNYIVDEQTWGEMVSGYRCAWCLAAQSVAWPEECEFRVSWQGKEKGCKDFGPHPRGLIRDHQMEFLENELKARANFNPPDPYDVLDIEQDDWRPGKTGLLIPRDISES